MGQLTGGKSGNEPGFSMLCDFCHLIGGTEQLMFFLIAALTLFLLYKAFMRFSPDPILSIFIFLCMGQLYINCFNAVRQTLAIAFIVYGLRYVYSRQLWMYLLCVGFAISFHFTAVIGIPLYWILNRCWPKWVVLAAGAVLLASSGLIKSLVAGSSYAIYANFLQFSADVTFVQVLYALFSATVFILSDRLAKGWKYHTIFFNINSIAMIIFSMYFVFRGTPFMMIVTRINYYFIFSYAFFIPAIFKYDSNRVRSGLFTFMTVAVMSALFLRTTLIKGEEYNLLPFRFNFTLFG